MVERLNSFQDELLRSARLAAPASPIVDRQRSSEEEAGLPSARPSGDDATGLPPGSPGAEERPAKWGHVEGATARKAISAAALSAALDLSDLAAATQRYSSGGAFLPILPLGTDEDSVDRGMPTVTTSSARWGI